MATAIVPSATSPTPQSREDLRGRDPQHDQYRYGDSSPILIKGAGGRRVGRIAIATPALRLPDSKCSAAVIKKNYSANRPLAVTIGLGDAPRLHARNRGRYRHYAGPVYRRGTYRDDGDRYIDVRGRIGELGLGIDLLRTAALTPARRLALARMRTQPSRSTWSTRSLWTMRESVGRSASATRQLTSSSSSATVSLAWTETPACPQTEH